MRYLVFILFSCIPFLLFAQEKCSLVISGIVHDNENNELPGATVLINGAGTVTGAHGEFVISDLCPGIYTILVQFLGFKDYSSEIDLVRNQYIRVRLVQDVTELERIEVVGQSISITRSNASLQLSQDDLEQLTGKSLGESLKSLPGVNALQSGPAVFKPIIQGLHSQRILILNNGIRQEGQQWGIEHAPEIDPFIASEMTVVKGSEAVRFGADALGGVIIINTPSLHTSRHLQGQIHTGYMTNNRMGILSGIFEGGFKNTDKWSWRLQGTGKKGGDFSTPNYVLSNTGLEELNFSGALGYRNANHGIELYGSSFNTEIGILRAAHTGNLDDLEQSIQGEEPWYIAPFTYDINNPKQRINHQLLKVKAYRNLSGLGTLNILYGGQFNQRREFDVRRSGRSSRPSLFMNLLSNVLDLSLDHEHQAHSGSIGTNFSYKYNYNETSETGRTPLVPDYHQFSTGVFIIEKINRDRWSFEAGGRYDFQYLQVLTFDKTNTLVKPEFNFHYVSGSIGATYLFKTSSRISSHLGISSRPPHVSELYSDGLHHGTGAIEEGIMKEDGEVLTDQSLIKKEVSTKWINTLQIGSKTLSADLSAYVNSIANYVFLRPVGSRETISGYFPVWKYEQTDALLAGADLLVSWAISKTITASGKLAYIYGLDVTRNDNLIFIPPVNGELGLTYSTPVVNYRNFYFKVAVPMVAKQNRAPITVYPADIPDYTGDEVYDIAPAPPGYILLNAEMGFKFPLRDHDFSISLAGENLTNQVYRNYMNRMRYFADEIGRNFTVRLKYSFHSHH